MSRFYFGGSSASSHSNSDSDDDTLPYPVPLQRSDFLAPNFSPSEYLSSLHNRHQTLEDLRSELRGRSQALNKELLDLVNSNYQDFLSLGSSLKGGDEKVEEVRVGLLGFRKEVEGVRKRIGEKEGEVEKLVEDKTQIRKQVAFGRLLLDFEARLTLLEERLKIRSAGKCGAEIDGYDAGDADLDDSEDTSDEDDEDHFISLPRLRKHVLQYRLVQLLEVEIGSTHPFVAAQAPRMVKIRDTLLLDLSTALKHTNTAGQTNSDRVMKILGVYREMDEAGEAIKVMKAMKK